MSTTIPQITLRPPTSTTLPSPPSFTPPTPTQLAGTWHVTHSTLPMWRSKRNVSITYTPIPSTASAPSSTTISKLDDLVKYQGLGSDKWKTVNGVDTADAEFGGVWHWRGKGWLTIATSKWEVLGFGEVADGTGGEKNQQWAVTYFAKTLFTPAGIDVYSSTKEGLGEGLMQGIKEELGKMEDEGLKGLVRDLFEVKRD